MPGNRELVHLSIRVRGRTTVPVSWHSLNERWDHLYIHSLSIYVLPFCLCYCFIFASVVRLCVFTEELKSQPLPEVSAIAWCVCVCVLIAFSHLFKTVKCWRIRQPRISSCVCVCTVTSGGKERNFSSFLSSL